MTLRPKSNWENVDGGNLGKFNALVGSQFCRGVLAAE
jgi:hypothetical protein